MAEQIYAEVSGSTSKVVTSLSTLETKLTNLNYKFTRAAGAATTFSNAIKGIGASSQEAKLNSLSRSISGIANAAKNLEVAAPQLAPSLNHISNAINSMPQMNSATIESLASLSKSFRSLGTSMKNVVANAAQLGGALNMIVLAVNQLPALNAEATKTLTLLGKVAPIAIAGSKGVKTLDTAVKNMNTSTRKATGGLMGMLSMAKRYIVTGIMIKLVSSLSNAVKSSMTDSAEWIESMNYFNVAYGQMAEKAGAYYTNISNALGIDMSSLIQNGAMFEAMSKSLGASADAAYLLSTNLVAIGIDLASLTGKGLQETWDALQSGVIAGQYKSLAKNYGINVTEASIAQTALNYGLKESVQTMAPLDKAMLRYLTVLDAAKIAQGDMAKTLESPANMTRVFQSAVMSLSRAVGNFMMPILIRVIPYVIAFTKVLAGAFNMLAGLMGFEPVSFKNTEEIANFTGGFDNLEDSVDGASGSVKELKKNIMGFDQFNILSENKASGGSGGSAAGGMNPDLVALLKGYDLMLEKATGTKVDEAFGQITGAISEITDALDEAAPSFDSFNKNCLKPFGEWVMSEGLPQLIKWLGSAAKFFADNPNLANDIFILAGSLAALKPFGAKGIVIAVTITGSIAIAEWFTGKDFESNLLTVAETFVKDWNSYWGEYDFSGASSPLDYWVEAQRADVTNYKKIWLRLEDFFEWGNDPLAVFFSFGNESPLGLIALWGAWFETQLQKTGLQIQKAFYDSIVNPLIYAWNDLLDVYNMGRKALGLEPLELKIEPIDTSKITASIKLVDKELKLLESYSKTTAKVFKDATEVGVSGAASAYGGMPYEVQKSLGLLSNVVTNSSTNAANAMTSATQAGKDNTVKVYGGIPYDVAEKLQGVANVVVQKSTDTGNALEYGSWIGKNKAVDQYADLNRNVSNHMVTLGTNTGTGATSAATALSDGTKTGTDNAREFVRKYVNNASKYLAGLANNTIDSTASQYSTFAGIPYAIQQKLGLVWSDYVKPKAISFPEFATGGFPEDGIFAANHNELVGKFSNGRTAVANNIQIVKGVSVGVADGVIRALQSVNASSSSSGYETMYRAVRDALKEVEFKTSEQYLDGEVVANAVISRISKQTNASGLSPIPA